MQGEFDGLLKWPLKAVMKIALVNPQAQGHIDKLSIELNYSERLRDEASAIECGSCKISYKVINLRQYVHNNCLHIRIVGIQF